MYGMKKGDETVIGFLFFMLACTGCSPYSDYENRYNGNIAGTVYDRASGQPLQGVTVYYDYYDNPLDTWEGTYYYYGEQVLDGATTTDGEGRFLVRNLEEQKQHILVLRKWPGFEQEYHIITPNPFKTDQCEIFLDSADAAFGIEPVSIHFKSGEDRHYLVVINEREIPVVWEMIMDFGWIRCSNMTGILAGMEAEAASVELLRNNFNQPFIQDTIFIEVLSTGETRAVPVSAEK